MASRSRNPGTAALGLWIAALMVGADGPVVSGQQFDLGGEKEKETSAQTRIVGPGEKPSAVLPGEVSAKRVTRVREKLEKKQRIRVTVRKATRGPGKVFRYIARIEPLDEDGKRHGPAVHYPRGLRSPKRVTPYEHGTRNGVEKLYNFRGDLVERIPWKNGKIHGVKKTFHENGKLANETRYENGEPVGVSSTYDDKGRLLTETPFKGGARHGREKHYWPETGDLKRIVPYENGEIEGTAKAFYKNGNPKWYRPYRDGALHGVVKRFGPKGELTSKAYYLEGERVGRTEYRKATSDG